MDIVLEELDRIGQLPLEERAAALDVLEGRLRAELDEDASGA